MTRPPIPLGLALALAAALAAATPAAPREDPPPAPPARGTPDLTERDRLWREALSRYKAGELEPALEAAGRALELERAALGDHPDVEATLRLIAQIHRRRGDAGAEVAALRSREASAARRLGPGH